MVRTSADWLKKTKSERQTALRRLITGQDYTNYINLVSAGRLGVVASLGEHFDYAIFGRDSIRVAKDLLATHPALVRTIILTLARLQGVAYNNQSEEEPGKIHHEYRNLDFAGHRAPDYSIKLMHALQQAWGGEGTEEMTYYGGCDTTPLYIRLVASYVKAYGGTILKQTYIGRDGQSHSIHDSVRQASDWVEKQLKDSAWGLLEYKRRNPLGLANQAWKDSMTAYLHSNGKVANFKQGIASVELQGYAYDALLDATRLLKDGAEAAARRRRLAKHLQLTTLEKFWMPRYHYFAQGLDRDRRGRMRQIDTLTSNPGLLLRSGLLYDLEPGRRTFYAKAIIKTLIGPEFLTGAGLRCRALRHKDMPGFPDYHGSLTTWPKETYEIAKGLHYHDFSGMADELDQRVLDSVIASGEFYEFFYINDDGTVWYDRNDAMQSFSQKFPGREMPVPEAGQAWTISAVLAILHRRQSQKVKKF